MEERTALARAAKAPRTATAASGHSGARSPACAAARSQLAPRPHPPRTAHSRRRPPGSSSTVSRSVRRGGITRGHSGVYLEQGTASLRDCNVSHNALTGISAVSADNAVLDVRNTDLVSNETMQLEMPPPGSRSYRRSISRDNRIHQEGSARARSGLVPPEHEAVASPSTVYNGVVGSSTDRQRNRNTSHGRLPQSPASDADEEIGSPN